MFVIAQLVITETNQMKKKTTKKLHDYAQHPLSYQHGILLHQLILVFPVPWKHVSFQDSKEINVIHDGNTFKANMTFLISSFSTVNNEQSCAR